jgi:UDP-glucose 4-epimerase
MSDQRTQLASAFSGARCVVTGGLGFIGSNLSLALAAAGARVTVVDALIPRHGGDRRNLDGERDDIEVIVADIADPAAVSGAVEKAAFVFNLAGQVSHVDSVDDPGRDLYLNTTSHLTFLELLRKVNLSAVVVYASTRQVYGRAIKLPVDEQHPVQPADVNGVSKHATEQFHTLYGILYGIRASVLRLTNVYGPRQRLSGDHQGFIPTFVRRAFEDQPITIYGDGAQRRDCVHVDDVVNAFLSAALAPKAIGQIINIGNPEALTVRTVADAIVAAVGTGHLELVAWPPERLAIDIGTYRGDYRKARRILGWEPAIAFEPGIKMAVDYYCRNKSWYL